MDRKFEILFNGRTKFSDLQFIKEAVMWRFLFGNPYSAMAHYIVMDTYDNCWRLLKNNKPIFISMDHGQLFGRKQSLNLVKEMKSFLKNIHVYEIKREINTGDTFFILDKNITIEFLTYSMGYENWSMHIDGKGYYTLGGGQLA